MEEIRRCSSSSSGSPRSPNHLLLERRGRSRHRTAKVCRTYSGAVTTVPKQLQRSEEASIEEVKKILLSGEALYSTAPFVKRSLAGVLFGGAEDMDEGPDRLFPSLIHRSSNVVETELIARKRSFSEPFQNTWTFGGDTFEIAGLMAIPVLVGSGTHYRDVATAGEPITRRPLAVTCEAQEDGTLVITSGSVDDLIDELIFNSTGADLFTYTEVFVNTHASFCSPQHLFDRLLLHLEGKILARSDSNVGDGKGSGQDPPSPIRRRSARDGMPTSKLATPVAVSDPPVKSSLRRDPPRRSLSAKIMREPSAVRRTSSADFSEMTEIQRPVGSSEDRPPTSGNILSMLNKSEIKRLKLKFTGKGSTSDKEKEKGKEKEREREREKEKEKEKWKERGEEKEKKATPAVRKTRMGSDGSSSAPLHVVEKASSAPVVPPLIAEKGNHEYCSRANSHGEGTRASQKSSEQESFGEGIVASAPEGRELGKGGGYSFSPSPATLVSRSKSDNCTVRRRRTSSAEAVVEELPAALVVDIAVYKARAVNVLRTWIKYQHWVLAEKRTRKALSAAVRRLMALGKTEERWGSQLQSWMKDSSKAWVTAISCHSPRSFTVVSVTSVLDIPAHELARQMTIKEHALFKAIDPAEYLHGRYAVPERSPCLRRFIRNFNRRTDWICTEVLRTASTKQRAAVIARFIRVAEQCQRLGNFNGLMEVVSALQTISIERLTKSWKLVPRLEMDCFEVLRAMMDSRGNFKTYRAVLERTPPPVVPFQSVLVKDLTFVEENTSMLEDGKVNFYKFWLMGSVLVQIRNYQQMPYTLKEIPAVQNYLSNFRLLGEDQQYEVSTQLEPLRRLKEERKKKKETKAKPRRSTSKGKTVLKDAHEGASLAPGSFGAHVTGMRGASSSLSNHSRSRSRDAATDDEISAAMHEPSLQQQLLDERAKRVELERVSIKLEEALYNALKKKNPHKVNKGASPQERLQALQALIQLKEQELSVLRGQYDALVATLITNL